MYHHAKSEGRSNLWLKSQKRVLNGIQNTGQNLDLYRHLTTFEHSNWHERTIV